MSVAAMGPRFAVSLGLLLVCAAAAATTPEKTAKEAPPPARTAAAPPPQFQAIRDMETLDYVRSGALVVAFLATAFAGQDIWLVTNLIVVSAFGTMFYFFPEPLIAYSTVAKLDSIHLYLGQQFGSTLLSLAVVAYFAQKSRQEGVRTAVFLSFLLGGLALLLSMGIDYLKSAGSANQFSSPMVTFSMLGCALWVVGNLIAVLRATSFGGSSTTMGSCLNKHLLIDLVIYCTMSFLNYGYPGYGLKQLDIKDFEADGIHAHLIRSIASIHFGTVIFCFQAMSFYDDRDKRVHLLCRLAAHLLSVPVTALYQWRFHLITMTRFYCHLLLQGGLLLNAALGYFGPFKGKLKLR